MKNAYRPSHRSRPRSVAMALLLPLVGCDAGFDAYSSNRDSLAEGELAMHLPNFFPVYEDFDLEPTDDVHALREEFDTTYRHLGYRFLHDEQGVGLYSSATRELVGFFAHPAMTSELERYAKDKVAHELCLEVWAYFQMFERLAERNQGGDVAMSDAFNELRRDYDNSGVVRIIGDQRYALVLGGQLETLEDWVDESTTALDDALSDAAPVAEEPVWPTTLTFSVAARQEERFRYALPEGATHAEVQLVGDGDADLYVADGREPTLSDYDCRPYAASSDETCSAEVESDVHVLVRGYAQVSDVTLTVSFR